MALGLVRLWVVRLLLAALLCAPSSAALAQAPTGGGRTWVARAKETGTSPLLRTKAWQLDDTSIKSQQSAFEALEELLSDPKQPILRSARNYIVLVAGAGWNESYLIRSECFSVNGTAVRLDRRCDLKGLRIGGELSVSVLGIKRPTDSFDLTWEVAQKKRARFDVLGFASLLLPSAIGGALAGASGYQYETAEEELTLLRMPVDLEVKASSVEFIKGENKEKPFGATFNNYADEYISLSVGAAVRKVDDVSLDLAANNLAAKEVSKLKTYALVDLHPLRIDPFSPAKWTVPFLTGGIEINTEQFNYGIGLGWRLPFIKNTSIAVLAVHALPEKTDAAKGQSSGASDKRAWKAAYLIHYIFPLPKGDKK